MFYQAPAELFIPALLVTGAAGILAVYHLVLYLQYKERIIWRYSLYLFSIAFYVVMDLIYKTSASFIDFEAMNWLTSATNFMAILGYASFLMEVAFPARNKRKWLFRVWDILVWITITFIGVSIIAATFRWEADPIAANVLRILFAGMGIWAIGALHNLIQGKFESIIKWGAFMYLVFMLVVLVTMLLITDKYFLGLGPMGWFYLGTISEVIVFSYAMSLKIKEALLKASSIQGRISRDLHDEVGATLSGVTLMSELVKQRLKDNRIADSQKLVDRIAEESKEMAEKMNDIVWTLNPVNDSLDKILNRIQGYGTNLCSSRNIRFHLVRPSDPDERTLHLDIRKSVYLISKEAINNAAKYSGAENIRYILSGRKNKHVLRIEDDGKGFDTSLTTAGNGLNNMKARAKEIGARLRVISGDGKGTVVELSF